MVCKIDEKKLSSIITLAKNSDIKKILYMMSGGRALSYTQIHSRFITSSGHVAYFTRKLVKYGLLRHDLNSRLYYISNLGIEFAKVCKAFESFAYEYDMDDVNQDGIIEAVVKGRIWKK